MEIIPGLKFTRTMKIVRILLLLGSLFLALGICIYVSILLYAKILGPPPLAVPQSSLYYANDGTLIGESHNGEKRYWVPLDEISPYLIDSTLLIEDKHFYEHHGFDYKRIIGAILADIKAMAKVQGASTISQQYARNLFLTHEKTWKRKLQEAFYTIRIEMNYSKQEILEGYLNTIYYGHGAYGVQAASLYYFGKNAKDLTLGEATMLAGIPKGPNIFSPFYSLEKAKSRQKIIVQTLINEKVITEEQGKNALNEKLQFVGKHAHSVTRIAPYFQDTVKNILRNTLEIDEKELELGGLKIYTTLDVQQQEMAEKTIDHLIADSSEIQIGFIAMDPQTGYVTALVGGRNYEESPFNRAIQAVRQPGSTIKPLLYYTAIERGFTPATLMRSELTTFRYDNNRQEYTPKNYNNKYANDEITMLQAMAVSDNVYAVKTHLFLGEETLIETAKRFGITTKMAAVPSLALGTSGVRVIDMAKAYSLFANGGHKVEPVFITRVENHRGEVIFEHEKKKEEEILNPEATFVTTHMMTGMFDRKLNGYATVTGNSIIKQITREYAGKSGSTNTDNWMIGFTPQLVTAIWTGFDDGKPVENFAEKGYAKNIWVRFMEEALKDEPIQSFKPPKGTIGVYIDPQNGKLATSDCPVQRFTYFIEGTEPTVYCTEHITEELPLIEKENINKEEKIPWYKKLFKKQ